ncbi:hypothetical protein BCP78_0038 [Bacillus phage BCP78]|uniref:Uncharacterized protein n=2 Tax=Tsarbombavirus BCP78 TaxID=1985182 RepID=J9PRW9_9CAUD|nr:hypothetical protein BCP78_0038 [Bacillus phage BCP78]YP_009783402.1 hypothetical protein QLX27_gp029 [Bacillus phage BCU4]AEW47045.1 hypothetical protein BCP78_0038 [Bacillus phage BCP78]AEW47535.1 hypothetical protein BCU4_0029 [Bacillus phage BCU4]
MKRLTVDEWKNVLRNLGEEGEEVEVQWLEGNGDSPSEWALGHECELFEDGFKTDIEAEQRLEDVYKELEESEEFKTYNNSSYDRYDRAMKEAGHKQSDFI